MFKNHLCGVKTGHRNGYVSSSDSIKHTLLMCFHTPFFCIIDGQRVEGKAGDFVCHHAGSPAIHGPISQGEAFINDWIYLSSDDDELDKLDLPYDTILTLAKPERVSTLISEIIEENARNDSYSDKIISGKIYELLSMVKREENNKMCEEDALLTHFKDVRMFILNHYGENWTLKRMAELSGYSVSRFSAIYTRLFGESPMNELLEERLKMAKHLISLHAYKISDVATMCGFSSIHYFSGFFKKHTGKTPSKY